LSKAKLTNINRDTDLAYYGRSYKLADPSCAKLGCSFVPSQGGAPDKRTSSAGVMSNREIRQIIEDENIRPILDATAMGKYFKYGGDSWIGYDDEETYALEQASANERCLGGTMIWSIDFDAETGGVGEDTTDGLGWIDPKLWEQPTPTVQCFFPCTMVLPRFRRIEKQLSTIPDYRSRQTVPSQVH
jgi:hypothetical protein